MTRRYRCFLSMVVIFVAIAFSGNVRSSDAALPKGSVAILVKGPSAQHVSTATSILTQKLVQNGYKVVDSKKLESIRRNKAAALALDGNVDAIMKLGKTYGFSTMVTAQVEAGEPVLNEFKLYTGFSSVALMVTGSNGQQIYADTSSGKQVGYTPSEAAQKSLDAAIKAAADKMLQ